jgi:hypothetical protein
MAISFSIKRIFTFVFGLSIVTLLASCSLFSKKTPVAKPVAKVFGTYLYITDLEGLVPKGATLKDSLSIVTKYIKHWTEEQVLLHQAENNLGDKEQDISKQIEDYRKALTIYAYEKELVRQKLDTVVKDDDIEAYYDDNKKDFELKNDIVKIVYVKVGKKAPNLDKIRGWINSNDVKDRDKLAKYCYQFAENFFLNDQAWLMFDDVLKEIPIQTYNQDLFLQTNKFVQLEDSTNIYFMGIKGYLVKNSTSPLSFERENIKKILLNKRKMEMMETVKQNLYQQALSHNDIVNY